MRIRIRLLTLMQIRIRLSDADPDPAFLNDAEPCSLSSVSATTLVGNILFGRPCKVPYSFYRI
jgi:hypothetical protein